MSRANWAVACLREPPIACIPAPEGRVGAARAATALRTFRKRRQWTQASYGLPTMPLVCLGWDANKLSPMYVSGIASSSLDASKQMEARLLSLHGKIAASEMEGAGMLAQTFTHEMPTPEMVLKGISDYADPKKAADLSC